MHNSNYLTPFIIKIAIMQHTGNENSGFQEVFKKKIKKVCSNYLTQEGYGRLDMEYVFENIRRL
ncbi:MAG: hypothetical protein R3Y24_14265 [Eubacteriales bacterium]